MGNQLNVRLPNGKSLLVEIPTSASTNMIIHQLCEVGGIQPKNFKHNYKILTLGGLNLLQNEKNINFFEKEASSGFFDVKLQVLVSGGKGGFGSMLRAQGGKMSSKKITNFDSCRDLSGRRLITIKAAQSIADNIELAEKEKKNRKEKLKRKIEDGLKEPVAKKVFFDDKEYEEQSEEIIKKTKNATKKAMKKFTKTKNLKETSKKGKENEKSVEPALFFDDEGLEGISSGSENESDDNSESNSDKENLKSNLEQQSSSDHDQTVADIDNKISEKEE
ncbi:hypothetical protein BB559_003416 [Furculomyces boomerangus]|uniref:SDE2-like domain-containing protein n=1 Tax=Furculomyces boomerangus TaxID=61424 RepID=A0A2T9YLD3_9FUNG|nr:hypothetical protein BB559_003416 [Furculomyces boomerangus]